MPRKQAVDGGTRNKIVEVGRRLFFERGFDATGVRAIMREVGADVGAFYYYFRTKDQLFDEVMDRFFEPYQMDFESVVAQAGDFPCQSLLRFFYYIMREVRSFRKKYAEHMHRTVRWAIRERTLTVIEPYIERIVRILIENGAKPMMDARTMAIFLSCGVGGCILHEESDWIDGVEGELRQTVNVLPGLDEEVSRSMLKLSCGDETKNG